MVHAVKIWIIRNLAKSVGEDVLSPEVVCKAKVGRKFFVRLNYSNKFFIESVSFASAHAVPYV